MCKKKRNKNHIYLIGGFGNNLFQLNHAMNLVEEGKEVIVHNFLITNGSKQILKIAGLSFHNSNQLLTELGVIKQLKEVITIKKHFNLKILEAIIKQKIFGIKGYFNYYLESNINNKFLEILRECVEQKKNSLNSKLQNKNVIHFRGGDFVRLGIQLDKNIYEKFPIKEGIIVTDDIPFTKNLLGSKLEDFEVVSQNPFLDFLTLATAKNLYLSNSTFGWWAAEVSTSAIEIFQPKLMMNNRSFDMKSTKKRKSV